MKINIYQINNERDVNNVAFLRYDSLQRFQGSAAVDSAIYDKVYAGDVDCKNLESVFQKFNLDRPPEFTGHSLSVSDVVEVCDGNPNLKAGFYFCDSFGFKKIDFEPEKTQEKDVRKIRVVMVEPKKEARIVDIEGDLDAMQHAVRGDIQAIYPFEEPVALVCNDESKMNGMELNRALYMEGDHSFNPEIVDIIAGTFFICAAPPESERFEGLSDEQAQKYLEMFSDPERFYRVGDTITAVKFKRPLDETIAESKQSVSTPDKAKDVRDNERDM